MIKKLLGIFSIKNKDDIDLQYKALIRSSDKETVNTILSTEDNDMESPESAVRTFLADLLPEEFVQYVIGTPTELMAYLEGKRLALSSGVEGYGGILLQIANELGIEQINESPTLAKTITAIQKKHFHIFSDFYDVTFASTFWNGVLPNGEKVNIPFKSNEDYFDTKTMIANYLQESNGAPSPITKSHLELKQYESTNILNVTCDKCGTPHNFKQDVPRENLDCTLCGKPLIIYTYITG
jgi:hypothetical protein